MPPLSQKVLKAWVKPSLLDLALGHLFQLGILTVEQKTQGKKILLTAEVPSQLSQLLSLLKKIKNPFQNEALFVNPKIIKIKNQPWAKNYQKYLKPLSTRSRQTQLTTGSQGSSNLKESSPSFPSK